MSTLSTHVLDTSTGRPAEGLTLVLEARATGESFLELSRGVTNADGRVKDLLGTASKLAPGVYRLTFDTGAWFQSRGQKGFYPYVQVVFEITATDEHYHVPLLLSPYGFSTYRGS
ncbi:hydroxyisourate hydrolase [Corallococcus praedator]|uniref:5-hydroxyisourate hydrolase n=1 Tax=Corallococcus praedator TaxID=2316724 RepID=A0ABX9QC92_9BACT|nr:MULTISPECIES: hydroxyisourate hydrolase [Corallococcus]RKH06146.1 hydroxyisourate hydrolase [Corallococcus sp. CA047B]RKH22566.1 hydroxyisourate hydrolase [Corallococcus sp. CA031C]RKH96322.1 hydroxyisourate hydrolase [Corallococcus praedator]